MISASSTSGVFLSNCCTLGTRFLSEFPVRRILDTLTAQGGLNGRIAG